ncbi:MAG: BrnT family toxin [Bryobacterales bacterium]|nr:BrnT family toxin [Bryobacterales bacterium]MDE0264186.1 BrnT family toxin [Bryobacterales bacterium]MDE0621685.1 BrnT family toxin [Bryobacterales bacterium]
MEFEWDEAKNQANIRKHGVSFEIARRVFDCPLLTSRDHRKDYGEDRYVSIGQVGDEALIVITHTRREGRIRLISARPASRKERQRYRDEIQ